MGDGIRRVHFAEPGDGGRCPCGFRWRADPRYPNTGRLVEATTDPARVTCWDCYVAAMEAQRTAERRRGA